MQGVRAWVVLMRMCNSLVGASAVGIRRVWVGSGRVRM
jgi:hypothetical protein